MRKIILWLLVLISLAAIVLRYSNEIAETVLGIKQKGGISILSNPSDAEVSLDGKQVGQTTYENKSLDTREYLVKIDKDGASWQGRVTIEPGTVTVINRDLAPSEASSAGEVLSLTKGRGMTIISNPSDADVEIDGKSYGKTPLSININSGDHTINLSHTNYLNRSIRANLPANLNLTVSVDLGLSEPDLTSVSTPVITQTQQVKVLSTPTSFLRVRDKASLTGKEIGRVNTGDLLVLLEQQDAWDRIKMSDGTEGFVSASYVQKVTTSSP